MNETQGPIRSFFTNLFGTIASGSFGFAPNADFIPKDSKGGTIKLRNSKASWLGLKSRLQQKYAYEYCYPVAAVVDRLAEYDLTSTRRIVSTQGKNKDAPSENRWATSMNRLLNQPNPLQSWEQFRGQQIVYKKVFGFCPVLPIVPAGFEGQPWEATMMINLPPWCFDVISNRQYTGTRIEDFVKKYVVNILGKRTEYEPNQILILEDSFFQDEAYDFLLPQSRLVGLDMAVSNICAAMEADNVLLRKRGALGFISHDTGSKDSVTGYIPMTVKQKKEAQRALNDYGLSWDQYQYAITRAPVKWNQTALDVRALGTTETITKCEKAICHRLGFPYILYEETETTYANGDNAAATVYQTNVIPNANKDAGKYNKFFRADEFKVKLSFDFESIGALQEDKQTEATRAKALDDALLIEYQNDLITLNEWREQRGYDPLPDDVGGKRYSERKKEEPQPQPIVDNPQLKPAIAA